VGRSGKCPFPGVPLSVKGPKPASPVRSVGWSTIHDSTPSCVADEVVTERCDGTTTILNQCVLCIVRDNGVLQKRPRITRDNRPKTRCSRKCILSQRAIRQTEHAEVRYRDSVEGEIKTKKIARKSRIRYLDGAEIKNCSAQAK